VTHRGRPHGLPPWHVGGHARRYLGRSDPAAEYYLAVQDNYYGACLTEIMAEAIVGLMRCGSLLEAQTKKVAWPLEQEKLVRFGTIVSFFTLQPLIDRVTL
jgi:hypothetical protein